MYACSEIRITVRNFPNPDRFLICCLHCVRTEKDKYSVVGEVYKYKPFSASSSLHPLDYSVTSRSVEHPSENPG